MSVDINPANTEVCIRFIHEIKMFGDLDVLLKLKLHNQEDPGVIHEELYELLHAEKKQSRIFSLFNKELTLA